MIKLALVNADPINTALLVETRLLNVTAVPVGIDEPKVLPDPIRTAVLKVVTVLTPTTGVPNGILELEVDPAPIKIEFVLTPTTDALTTNVDIATISPTLILEVLATLIVVDPELTVDPIEVEKTVVIVDPVETDVNPRIGT